MADSKFKIGEVNSPLRNLVGPCLPFAVYCLLFAAFCPLPSVHYNSPNPFPLLRGKAYL